MYAYETDFIVSYVIIPGLCMLHYVMYFRVEYISVYSGILYLYSAFC